MKVLIKQVTEWKRVVDAARWTSWKGSLEHDPSRIFKQKILRAEHSPIRLLEFDIQVFDVPYWVSVHFVRHHIGLEKFVTTQRDDRVKNDIPRGEARQDASVNIQFSINAQALINISRARLCHKASKETREVWQQIIAQLWEIAPEVADACVPNCIYRGFCPEMQSCGFWKTFYYQHWREEYTQEIK